MSVMALLMISVLILNIPAILERSVSIRASSVQMIARNNTTDQRLPIEIQSLCAPKRHKHKNVFCALCTFLWLKLNDSAAQTDRDRLRAIGSTELFHDVFDVDLDS